MKLVVIATSEEPPLTLRRTVEGMAGLAHRDGGAPMVRLRAEGFDGSGRAVTFSIALPASVAPRVGAVIDLTYSVPLEDPS